MTAPVYASRLARLPVCAPDGGSPRTVTAEHPLRPRSLRPLLRSDRHVPRHGDLLVAQTVIVVIWIVINITAVRLRWDPYPFILLNLVSSTQASYAAPLILLAQNRQAERDRDASDRDREVNARTLADTEYVARELAAIRLAVTELTVTADEERCSTPSPADR
jgi:hypothetical protein